MKKPMERMVEMKTRYKRLLSMLLAVLLIFSLSTTAFAATDTGDSIETVPAVTEQAGTVPEDEGVTQPTEEGTEPAEEKPSAVGDMTETVVEETVPTEESQAAEDTATVSTEELMEPVTGYDPNDPDNPYPYGLPVTEYIPEDVLEYIQLSTEYGFSLMAADNQGSIPDEMWDNSILRALEYTGYDVQRQKDKGQLYQYLYIGSRLPSNDPSVLSDISYWSSGSCPNGDETVADSRTPTGKAPNISYFESNGLVCASFVTYYLCNYLPNVEGVDTSVVYEKAKEVGSSGNAYYLTTVSLWKNTLDALAGEADSGVTKYTNATTAYENLVPGDVVVFANSGSLTHVAIYAGEYSLYYGSSNLGTYHFMIHVGNSRGPEISIIEWMSTSTGSKASDPVAWYHLEFNSEEDPGTGRIVKDTNTGKDLGGWGINLYTDEGCTQLVEGAPFTMPDSGVLDIELAPGDYWCREVSISDPYWKCDTSTQKLTIVSGEVSTVTFKNAQYGRGRIIKDMPDGGSTEDWSFDVYYKADHDFVGTYTTGADGTALTAYLLPGEYLVYENIPEGSLYYCEGQNPQTVTVKAGETAEVVFTNRLSTGRIEALKVDTTGTARSGGEFLLEWSEDGTTWASVTFSETVTKGGCSSAGLTDGRLTTGSDGKVSFEGLHPELYYRLSETKAPEGLQMLTGYAYEGKLPVDRDMTVSLRVVNAPVFTLPETGGSAFWYLPAGLFLCCGVCGLVLLRDKRRKKV